MRTAQLPQESLKTHTWAAAWRVRGPQVSVSHSFDDPRVWRSTRESTLASAGMGGWVGGWATTGSGSTGTERCGEGGGADGDNEQACGCWWGDILLCAPFVMPAAMGVAQRHQSRAHRLWPQSMSPLVEWRGMALTLWRVVARTSARTPPHRPDAGSGCAAHDPRPHEVCCCSDGGGMLRREWSRLCSAIGARPSQQGCVRALPPED